MTDWLKDQTGADILDHDSRHEDGGNDEIVVTGLSGLLADDQHVLDAEVTAVAVALTTLHANTILKADADHTPIELSVAVQTLIGRITAGVITALTATQVRTLLNIEDASVALATVKADSDIADAITKKHSHTPQAYEADPTGGAVIDAEARVTIASLIDKLQTLGFLNST